MPENAAVPHTTTEEDTSASTEMFRAFVDEGAAEADETPQRLSSRALAVIAGVVALIAILAAIAVL